MTPDYGTSGAPNMDPYYVSAAQEKAARIERIQKAVGLAESMIGDLLEDLDRELTAEGADLASVAVDVGNLGITIEVRS